MRSEFAIAVHALVYLNHKSKTLDSEALAVNICTNPARVRKVMSSLKKGGLINTKEGMGGGYSVARAPDTINLRQIAEILEMPVVEASWRSGDYSMPCLVASGMGDLMEGIYRDLNSICLERLETITIKDLDIKIFIEKTENEKI